MKHASYWLSLFILTAQATQAQVPVHAIAGPGTGAQQLSLWELIVAAGWVIYPLLFVSVLVLTLVFFYLLTFRESAIVTPEILRRVEPFYEDEDLEGLSAFLADRPQAVARILEHTLKFIYRNPDADSSAISAVAEAEGSRIATQLNQRVVYVMDLGVLAPMLGLFGTVVGILRSFGSIAMEQSSMRTMLLAGGVSQALVSTAIGLVVGITAMACYAYFRGQVQYLISLLEGSATPLIQQLILLRKRHGK
jgi:biopolymer transport protein ExbB